MAENTYTAAEVGVGAVLAPILLALVVVLSFPLTMIQAFVAMKIWNWFPVEYFHLQPISYWMMVGFYYVKFAMVSGRHIKDERIDFKGMLIGTALIPWVTLLVAYLIHLKVG